MKTKITFIILLGLNLGFTFMNLPPALESLMVLYGAMYTEIAVLMSALLWTHAAIQVPGGMISDRIGTRAALFISLFFMLAGNLLPSVAPNLGLAILGRVLSGTGTGLGFIATMKMITIIAPPGRAGSYQAQLGGAFSIGSVVAYMTIPHISLWGWRWIYLVSSLVCLPLAGILFIIKLQERQGPFRAEVSLKQILRMPPGWILGIYHALSYGSVLTLGNWIPSLLAEVWPGQTATQLAWGGASVMLISGVGRMGGGFVLLKFPSMLIANGSIFVLFLLFSSLCVLRMPSAVMITAFLAALFASVNFGAFWDLASRAVPSRSLGTLFGFVNLLANLGAVCFTLMFGWIKDQFGTFSWGFGIVALITIWSLLIGRRILYSMLDTMPADQNHRRPPADGIR